MSVAPSLKVLVRIILSSRLRALEVRVMEYFLGVRCRMAREDHITIFFGCGSHREFYPLCFQRNFKKEIFSKPDVECCLQVRAG